MDSFHRSKHLWCLKRCKEASIDSLHLFKHQRCLLRCKEASKQRLLYACLLSTKGAYYVVKKQASISAQCAVRSAQCAVRSCLLALLLLFATQGKQALARDRGQDKKKI
jgi:hypothetical protein